MCFGLTTCRDDLKISGKHTDSGHPRLTVTLLLTPALPTEPELTRVLVRKGSGCSSVWS